jgi:hypothetical protein
MGDEGSGIVFPWPPPAKPSYRVAIRGIDVASPNVASAR